MHDYVLTSPTLTQENIFDILFFALGTTHASGRMTLKRYKLIYKHIR